MISQADLIEETFRRLEAVAGDLNDHANRAGEILGSTERRLVTMGIGVSQEMPIPDDPHRGKVLVQPYVDDDLEGMLEPFGRADSLLCYGKMAGRWRIYWRKIVVAKYKGHDEEVLVFDETVDWSSMPKETKIRAAACVPDLILKMEGRVVELNDLGVARLASKEGLAESS